MEHSINFRKILKQVVEARLHAHGYILINSAKSFPGVGISFFRKNLFDNINCYVCFQLYRAGSFAEDDFSFSRSFGVGLLRNRGDKIDFTVKEGGHPLFTSLSYLLWNDFQVYKYGSPNYIWQFTDTNELKDLLELIIFDLEIYGIPWLEAS